MEVVQRVYGGCTVGCLEGVWNVTEDVRRVYRGCVEGVWRVYGGCTEGVRRVYGG